MKRLAKSKVDKKIFGVCGGLANYLDCDPTLIRFVWTMTFIYFGIGFVTYLIAALILPEE